MMVLFLEVQEDYIYEEAEKPLKRNLKYIVSPVT
jgi:hypothetical protein